MNSAYTAVIKQDTNWWIGWIEEVPGVNCQESSREQLLRSLRETLTEAIELNRVDALEAVNPVGAGFKPAPTSIATPTAGSCTAPRRCPGRRGCARPGRGAAAPSPGAPATPGRGTSGAGSRSRRAGCRGRCSR